MHTPRVRLAACLLPVLLITAFIPIQWLAHGGSFFTGVTFFSQPYMTKGWIWFTTKYPNWMDMLQVQK